MSNTVHLDLLQAMAAALGSLPGVPPDRVHIDLPTAVDGADCPAIVLSIGDVRFDSIGSDGQGFDLVKASVDVKVMLHTRGAPHTQVADPIIGQLHAAFMADASLGGRALRLRLAAGRPTQEPGDGTAGRFELLYQVTAAVDERTLAIVTQ